MRALRQDMEPVPEIPFDADPVVHSCQSQSRWKTRPVARLSGEGRNPPSAEELTPVVYDELRRRAQFYMSRERPGHTLQPTALVHGPT
jgi:hypothetical protein